MADDGRDDASGADASRDIAADEAALEALRVELKRRDDAYELEHDVKSCRELIAADPEWNALYLRLKAGELALAERRRKPGGCAFYIPRRRRYCASRAADGCDGFCSLHAPQLGENPSAPRLASCAPAGDAPHDHPDDGESNPDGRGGARTQQTTSRKTNIHRRMKKMTNPLAAPHREPPPPPDWSSVFADPTLPTLCDVGCAKGRFLQRAAGADADLFEARHGRRNLLGLEIYPPLVAEANAWRDTHAKGGGAAGHVGWDGREARPIDNLHFIACNANVSLDRLRVPNLDAVSVLFPDPWSRKKHASRRVVTPQFVDTLAKLLPSGGTAYCCSDVRPLAAEMQALFLANEAFELCEETFRRCGEWFPDAVARDEDAEGRAGDGADGGADGGTESKSGDGATFEHVFPAHRYEWQSQVEPSRAEGDEREAAAAEDDDAGTNDGDGERAEDDAFARGTEPARWLATNPYTVPTERDLVCESKWRPVYRFVARRKA